MMRAQATVVRGFIASRNRTSSGRYSTGSKRADRDYMNSNLGLQLNRRLLLGAALAGTGRAVAAPFASDELPRPNETRKGDMLYRTFGNTGETVSVIGLGGSHIGQTASEELAIRLTRSAIDRGVNFMDNSWDYNNGDG